MMIRCTRNLLLILVATFALTGRTVAISAVSRIIQRGS